jgi:hypothetical protein
MELGSASPSDFFRNLRTQPSCTPQTVHLRSERGRQRLQLRRDGSHAKRPRQELAEQRQGHGLPARRRHARGHGLHRRPERRRLSRPLPQLRTRGSLRRLCCGYVGDYCMACPTADAIVPVAGAGTSADVSNSTASATAAVSGSADATASVADSTAAADTTAAAAADTAAAAAGTAAAATADTAAAATAAAATQAAERRRVLKTRIVGKPLMGRWI